MPSLDEAEAVIHVGKGRSNAMNDFLLAKGVRTVGEHASVTQLL